MGGIGVLLQLAKQPTKAASVPKLHRALWKRIRARLDEALTSKVTRGILVNYLAYQASEGFSSGNWDAHDDYLSFSFHDGGDDWPLKYASYHWTDRAISDVYADLQAVAQRFGAELVPRPWHPGKDVYFFIGDDLVCVDDDRVQVFTDRDIDHKALSDCPFADLARKLVEEQRCLCELCRPPSHVEVVTTGSTVDADGVPILVFHFVGEYVDQTDATTMRAATDALLAAHPHAQGMVLDATELSYTTGKGLDDVVEKGRPRGWAVSTASRGLHDFIKIEKELSPSEWLFPSLHEAIAGVRARVVADSYEIHAADETTVVETARREPRGRRHHMSAEVDGEPTAVENLFDLCGRVIEIVYKRQDGSVRKRVEFPVRDAKGDGNEACRLDAKLIYTGGKLRAVIYDPRETKLPLPANWAQEVAAIPTVVTVSLDHTSAATGEILQMLERCPQLELLYLNHLKLDPKLFASPLLGRIERLELHGVDAPPGAIDRLALQYPTIDIRPAPTFESVRASVAVPKHPAHTSGQCVDADGIAILVIRFVGEYEAGSAATMKSACDALLEANPDVEGIVLDATQLAYASGKELDDVVPEGRPMLWVVSGASFGLFDLIRSGKQMHPGEWLFPSVDAAVAAVRARVVADSYVVHAANGVLWYTWQREPRGRRKSGLRLIEGVWVSGETLYGPRGRLIEDLFRKPDGTLRQITELPVRDAAGGDNAASRLGARLVSVEGRLDTIDYSVQSTKLPLPADWVDRVAAHPTVTTVALDGTGVTTAAILQLLERCPKLERLWLNSLHLDAELFTSPLLANVKLLWLYNTVTPPGAVKQLAATYPTIDINPKSALE